ncbi:archaemetzincin [Desulfonema magnum]|uniref:Peptidase, M54 family n=1 Tax=Desulfonema magnum TaxID=45655 RepID=A0A975BI16_9BACT|nr:archaemetzincin [Desulfonema magnum]QTA85688.1 Peptidase, M54 family [Desulfonema magnum]
MKPVNIRVGVVPVGEVPEIAPKVIASHFLGYLNLSADILPRLEHPEYAFDKRRCQYNAALIIKAFESEHFDSYDKVIGVFDVDLFVPLFTHVFGEARLGGKYAIISLFRLEKNLERAAKVALHEFGHLCHLEHCRDIKCLMHFSKGLEELDNTPLYFCKYCSAYLESAFSRVRT